jgi:hypothetical protein
MDDYSIQNHLRLQWNRFSPQNTHQILQGLRQKENVEIEDRKTALFRSKLDFVCLAKCLREAMLRDTGFRQLKRFFLGMFNMFDEEATTLADKYNEGVRVYDRMDRILENINYVVDVDIRDLSLHELSLAHNKSWLIRRSTLSKKKMRKKANHRGQPGLLAAVDWPDVQNSVNYLQRQNWFLTIQHDHDVVSTVMDHVSDRMLYKSITG